MSRRLSIGNPIREEGYSAYPLSVKIAMAMGAAPPDVWVMAWGIFEDGNRFVGVQRGTRAEVDAFAENLREALSAQWGVAV